MPSALSAIEYASRFGALDETASGRGEFVHAHVLRELARNGNRLVSKGDYLVQQMWNRLGSDGEAVGARLFTPAPRWQRVYLGTREPHKRWLPTGDLRMRARIDSGEVVLFQFVTGGHELRADIRAGGQSPNVIACTGTGDWALYETDALRLGVLSDFEAIEVWATAEPSTSLMNETTYGAPNRDAPETVYGNGFVLSTATWDWLALNGVIGQHVVQFFNVDDVAITPPLRFHANSSTELTFDGEGFLTPEQITACNAPGVTFSIFSVTTVRMGSLVIRERDGWR